MRSGLTRSSRNRVWGLAQLIGVVMALLSIVACSGGSGGSAAYQAGLFKPDRP